MAPCQSVVVSISLIACCTAPLASGQVLSAGLIGGASLTQDFQNREVGSPPALIYSTPKRWLAGVMAEVRLPLHLSIEVDGLYHELEFTRAGIEPDGSLNSVSPAPVVTWEFPVLTKYRFTFPLITPFVEAGPAFRTSGNLNGASPSNHGFVAGVGAEAHVWKFRVAPQFRYLRWARDQAVTLMLIAASFPPIVHEIPRRGDGHQLCNRFAALDDPRTPAS